MRCNGWSSLGISGCSVVAALVLAGPASAHVVATPAYLPSQSSESITLTAPNERSEPMTGFSVTAAEGLEIEHAHPAKGWSEPVGGLTASWVGGSLASGEDARFGMTLKADAEPGIVRLEAEQSYGSGEVVRWPVAITVLPAEESPSQNLALAGIVGLIGVLLVVAVATLAWRRRSLQER